MSAVQAIYQHGVFKPLGDVGLPENERVLLSIQPLGVIDAQSWLDRVRERQQRIVSERGCFPDSALDIAEDRRR